MGKYVRRHAMENNDDIKNIDGENAQNHDDIDDVLDILKKSREKKVASPDSDAVPFEPGAEKKHTSAPVTGATAEYKAIEKKPDATKVDLEPVKSKKPQNNAPVESAGSSDGAKRITTTESAGNSSSTGISLDDFNYRETASEKSGKKSKKSEKNADEVKVTFLGSVKFGIIKIVLYVAFVALCSYFISKYVISVGNDVYAFVKNDEEITVTIPEGASTEEVAELLCDSGVIKHPKIFKVYADYRISKRSYLEGDYAVGDVKVNPMMNYDALINAVKGYEKAKVGTVRITIPEGLTVDETLELLEENGVGKKEDYVEALNNFEYEYRFAEGLTKDKISPIRFDTNYSYRLEGYLFPDTYDFYLNENPISAIDKFLVNFERKFEEEFYERCDQLGMTVDEVITLASLIEKEGNNASDYYEISSVFHNRLNNSASYPYLASDASIQYALDERTGAYDINTGLDHPYNTYIYKGLPPGPICNPGIEAIYAALYPEKTSYYFFYTKKNGETVFSRTYEEHQRYINADR